MFEQPVKKEQIHKILDFLSPLSLFKNIKRSFLIELISSMKILHVTGGENIVRQGDTDKNLYILYHGRLGVYYSEHPESYLKETLLKEIIPGQIFGEVGLLSNYTRIRTVTAVRDSILLVLDQESFQKIEKNYPAETLELAKSAITRIVTRQREAPLKKTMVISVAPAGDSNHRPLAEFLFHELNKFQPTILVNLDICSRHFGKDCSAVKFSDAQHDSIMEWLTTLEDKYDYIIYETDMTMTPWTERCLRQSDRIFFTIEEGVSHVLNSIEIAVYTHPDIYSSLDLIFLHKTSQIKGTSRWLTSRPVKNYLHINLHSFKDRERLIRFINGTSFGVVMNGGGARGMAHLGALMALNDMNIPIDYVAGCSMGAFAASLVAMDMTIPEMLEISRKALSKYRNEYAIPVVSLMTGESTNEVCRFIGGDRYIEDLPYPFFCTSANLTQNEVEVIDKGPLWLALRMTISLPGIFPPIYNESGDTIVDGGILNNMPVDILRNIMGPGKILAINCSIQNKLRARFINETSFTYWKHFVRKINPFSKKKDAPDSIFNTMLLAMHLSANLNENIMEKQADYCLELDTKKFNLLEFFRFEEIVEWSYRDSKEKLPKVFAKKLQSDLWTN